MKTNIVCISLYLLQPHQESYVVIYRASWSIRREYNNPSQASLKRLIRAVSHTTYPITGHTDSRLTLYHDGWKWEV